MTTESVLEDLRNELALDLLAGREVPYPFHPTPHDIHIASSGLQKGIRRGDATTALACAARLIESDPSRLWRRLAVIAVEDVGVANPSLMGQVVAVAGRKPWCVAHGGQWLVAAHLVDALCRSTKDRSADDLIVLCEHDPDLADHRRCWWKTCVTRLAELICDDTLSIQARAVAAWYGCGTARYRSATLRERRGDPNLIFDGYRNAGFDEQVVETCRFAARQSSYPMAIFVPILAGAAPSDTDEWKPDPAPEPVMIGSLPCYVFDAYTRPGRTAIVRLLDTSRPLQEFLNNHTPRKTWTRITGNLLFRVEGGLLSPRLRSPLADRIRERADVLIPGLPPEAAPEGMELLRDQLPRLNGIRSDVVASNFR